MKRVTLFGAAIAVLSFWLPSQSTAQEAEVARFTSEMADPSTAEQPRRALWGTDASVRTIHALAFQAIQSTTTFTYDASSAQRYRTGGFPFFQAALSDLPAGAELLGLEMEACDRSDSAEATVILFRHPSPEGVNIIVGRVGTGAGSSFGCGFYGHPANLPAGNFVDNGNNSYTLRIGLGSTDFSTSIGAVRVFYRLRISPAPTTYVTFTDVPPSHPFFRSVEALAASGSRAAAGPAFTARTNR